MYNPQLPQPGMMGQPMPQGGNMGVTPPMGPTGPTAPMGPMPPGGGMAGAMGPQAMGGMGGQPGPMGPGQLDPAAIQQILALQQQQGRRAAVDRQLALANQLRAEGSNQLSGRRVGVANLGASIANNYVAGRQMNEAETKGAGLDKERTAAAEKYMSLISGLRGGGGAMP